MNEYSYVGSRVVATASFTDVDGVPTDPTSVTCSVLSPSGTLTSPTPTSSATGTWSVNIDLTEGGVWWVRFEGTGALVVAVEQMVFAAASNVE